MNRVVTLSLILVLAVLLAIVTSRELAGPVKVTVAGSDSFIRKARIIHSANNSNKWIADVERISLYQNGAVARLQDIVVTMPERKLSMRAKNGSYDMGAGYLDVKGEVTATNGEYRIISKDIAWDFKKETMTGKNGVYLTGKGVTLRADTLTTRKGDEINLKGNVKVVFD
jgi:hypothetical protein